MKRDLTLSQIKSAIIRYYKNNDTLRYNIGFKLYKKQGGKLSLTEILSYKKNGVKHYYEHQEIDRK